MGGTANIVEPVTVYNHEQGLNYDNGSVFCETARLSLGNGDQIARVTQVIPDEKTEVMWILNLKHDFILIIQKQHTVLLILQTQLQ